MPPICMLICFLLPCSVTFVAGKTSLYSSHTTSGETVLHWLFDWLIDNFITTSFTLQRSLSNMQIWSIMLLKNNNTIQIQLKRYNNFQLCLVYVLVRTILSHILVTFPVATVYMYYIVTHTGNLPCSYSVHVLYCHTYW